MKKVWKFVKNNVLGLIFGLVIGGSTIAVLANISSSVIDYDNTNSSKYGATATKVDAALDELYEMASKLGGESKGNSGYLPTSDSTTYTQSTFVQNLQVGDLIKMTPINTKVRLNGSKSGYTSYLTTPTYLDPSELQYWRVIRKNSNGTVDVVSEYVSSTSVYFNSVDGYTNFVGYLNELASYYENPKYTIGSRMMGYDGQTQYITDKAYFYKSSQTAPQTSSTSSPTTGTGEEYSSGKAGDTLYLTDYQLVKTAYTNKVYNGNAYAYKVGTTTATNYWLASRHFYYGGATYFAFYDRYVNTSGGLASHTMRSYGGSVWNDYTSGGSSVRPILTLKSTITSSGTESSTGAYILG